MDTLVSGDFTEHGYLAAKLPGGLGPSHIPIRDLLVLPAAIGLTC